MQIYLVVSASKAPGRVYAIFRSQADAELHLVDDETFIVARTLFTGQANNPSFNR